MIQPTDGINIGNGDEVLEGGALGGGLCVSELTEDVEGFVKNEIAMRHGERNWG